MVRWENGTLYFWLDTDTEGNPERARDIEAVRLATSASVASKAMVDTPRQRKCQEYVERICAATHGQIEVGEVYTDEPDKDLSILEDAFRAITEEEFQLFINATYKEPNGTAGFQEMFDELVFWHLRTKWKREREHKRQEYVGRIRAALRGDVPPSDIFTHEPDEDMSIVDDARDLISHAEDMQLRKMAEMEYNAPYIPSVAEMLQWREQNRPEKGA